MGIIIDSNISFEEAILGSLAPVEIISNLTLFDVFYYSFDEKIHQGQIMVNKEVERKAKDIFAKILELKFPIGKCVPMSEYAWNDDLSMNDNNSSAFCYRKIAGTSNLSDHSFGYCLDINPLQNPFYLRKEGAKPQPAIGSYDVAQSGTLVEGSELINYITKDLNCRWGRFYTRCMDNHHFDLKWD